MFEFDKLSSLSPHDNDKLTEDTNAINTMLGRQDGKPECIHTMLKDFVKVNGIVNDYTGIPEKERLEKFSDILHMRLSLAKEGAGIARSFFPFITICLTGWNTMSL